MKTVMILGAGEGQIPFISICKKRGYRTIVVSPEGDYPGFALADKAYYFDTRDKEKILETARQEHIDAITTDQTDVSVPTVAYVAEKLGLTGIGTKLASKLTNKFAMREAAQKAGVAVPKFAKASSCDRALEIASSIGYPVIIKPVDSSGSRGVLKITSAGELKNNFISTLSCSTSGEIIVEKFLVGKEYLADGFACDSVYHTLDVGTKDYFRLPGHYISRLCIFHSAYSKLDTTMLKVKDVNDHLFKALGFPFGITHAEYIYVAEEDKVYLVECAGRGGGVFLSSHLTPWATGFDTNTFFLKYLVENAAPPELQNLDNKISAWMCFSLPEGTITAISGEEELLKIPGVKYFAHESLTPGKKVKALQSDKEKYGPILFAADSESTILKAMEEVKKVLKITISGGNGENDIIWQ